MARSESSESATARAFTELASFTESETLTVGKLANPASWLWLRSWSRSGRKLPSHGHRDWQCGNPPDSEPGLSQCRRGSGPPTRPGA